MNLCLLLLIGKLKHIIFPTPLLGTEVFVRGPAENITIIATAYSEKDTWGSGDHEPIAWTTNYGNGRVFVTVLGHVMKEEFKNAINGINSCENKNEAIYSVGFQTLFARGAQWATTGKVTFKIPDNFPSETKSSAIEPSGVNLNF